MAARVVDARPAGLWPQPQLRPRMGVKVMSSKFRLLCRAITWTAGMILLAFLFVNRASAQSASGDYLLFVGSGFLCQPGDISTCPAAAKSSDESTFEVSGAGTFNTKSKSVLAAGTFTRKSPDGNSLETGIWMANQLVSFESYGIAPGELMRQGAAFGLAPFSPRRMPAITTPMPTGGLAIFRIRLLSASGIARTALLQVNCALGKVPDERPTEGIRLNIEGGGGEFDQEIGGRAMFIATRPGIDTASKPRTAEPNTASGDIRQ